MRIGEIPSVVWREIANPFVLLFTNKEREKIPMELRKEKFSVDDLELVDPTGGDVREPAKPEPLFILGVEVGTYVYVLDYTEGEEGCITLYNVVLSEVGKKMFPGAVEDWALTINFLTGKVVSGPFNNGYWDSPGQPIDIVPNWSAS